MSVRILPALTAGALLAGAVAPALAEADHLRCGDVVTESVTLDADLLRCPGAGLVIGADGVTVDLGGHVIEGVRASFGNTGVVNPGFAGVRIQGGTIREFVTGVSVRPRPPGPGEGERVAAAPGVLQRLEFVDNRVGVELTRVHGTTLRRSVIRGSWEAGVVVDATTGRNRIVRNVIHRSWNGVSVRERSTDTVVSGNWMLDNDNYGVVVSARYDWTLPPIGTLVAGNHTDGNAADGILVAGGQATLLERNHARGNGDDGIEVRCADARCPADAVTLAGNVADDNAHLGIEAHEGTVDGGGNLARRNGDPQQCTGVACS